MTHNVDLVAQVVGWQASATWRAPLTFSHIASTEVTDDGVTGLAKMTTLERLSLQDLPVTDRAISELAALPKLNTLYLSQTEVTDASIAYLHAMDSLAEITLSNTNMSPNAVVEFGRSHPGIKMR